MQGSSSIITAVTRHRVSANVLMLIFLLAGTWALTKFSTRFFPEFESNTISVSVAYPGADSTETETALVIPLENALRSLPDLDSMSAYARDGSASITLDYPNGTNMEDALADVKSELERITLPINAKAPKASVRTRTERVALMTIAANNRNELRGLARRLETDFNAQGIAKLEISGLPAEEIDVVVDQRRMVEFGLTLQQVGNALRKQNVNAAVGSARGLGNERKLRVDSKSSDLTDLYQIVIAGGQNGETVKLRDIAVIEQSIADDNVTISYNGQPAIRFTINKNSTGDIIDTADKVYEWADKFRATLPSTVKLVLHDEAWRAVDSRLKLLINNGIGGMIVVVLLLYIFLSSQVALWVAVGIPVAMFGTLFVFQQTGGTINMISMFALIMAVGIIVDDSIVVGENAQYRIDKGEPPMRAVTSAARTMFVPVFASSFTTIASFLPLFLVGGSIGSIIFDIPMIIVCILIAALIECFLILPGHLYQSFMRSKPSNIRKVFDKKFNSLRENYFRPFAGFAVRHAPATIAGCLVLLFLSISLITNGFVSFRFFPGSEGNKLNSTIEFTVGTPRATMESYVDKMIVVLKQTAKKESPDEPLIEHISALYGYGNSGSADYRARIEIEMVDPDLRVLTTTEFAGIWRRKVGPTPAGVERLSMRGQRGGPPGQDLEIEIYGKDIETLKVASLELQKTLGNVTGLSSVTDDTPYGEDLLLFDLTPLSHSLGISVSTIADQLRYAVAGFKVETFTEGVDEIELKVTYAGQDNNVLESLYIRLPHGEFAPLSDLVTWKQGNAFQTILHRQGRAAITVTADLDDDSPSTSEDIIAALEKDLLPAMRRSLGVDFSFEGRQSQQRETIRDMQLGLVLALVLIFFILTFVFNSWSLPLVVMASMPLGIIGTVFGHWFMGLTMSILSFFGVFTLMGIIVNNSIVLVRCFQDLGVKITDTENYNNAIVEASCLRLRAVLLTSLTTIGGLTPLMFERSLQARFLIPMATSIVFGLAFATIIILLFTPACMSIHGSISRFLLRIKKGFKLPLGLSHN